VEIIALCRGSEARRKAFFTKWGSHGMQCGAVQYVRLEGVAAARAALSMFQCALLAMLQREIKRRCNSGVSGA